MWVFFVIPAVLIVIASLNILKGGTGLMPKPPKLPPPRMVKDRFYKEKTKK